MKPIINLDDVTEFEDVEENGIYTSKRAMVSRRIGARDIGYNLVILPPGKVQCPFHNHRGEEEMFLILDGEGELRFGSERYPIRKNDVIACPTGGADVAHQIINTGTTDMRYLALSTFCDIDVCEYPDSGKMLVVAGRGDRPALHKMVRAEGSLAYYDGERTTLP
ncbi:MAG TPA: cupin domain-containing protein [Rhizobiaceae bacterium]|nr:cupin domain-containing protein [Rhizobiaceae bacterium]